MKKRIRTLACLLLVSTLTACVGNGDKTVGGNVSGLLAGSTLVLQNNGGDNLTLTANGPFEFATSVTAGAAYNVTVLTQPAGEICTVTNGTGTIDSAGDPVTNISVSCTANTNITGTVIGLKAGTSVTLANATEQLAIASNGAFSFVSTLPVGTSYSVTVAVQPAGLMCTIANATGVIQASVATNVIVTCS